MTASRNRRGVTETPVDRYQHPDTGKTITLVAMLHVAEPSFYVNVAWLACRLQRGGAEVHYELSRSPMPSDPMTDEERDLIARMRKGNSISLVAKVLGLETQHGLAIQPGWVNTDMTMLEMLREHRYPQTMASSSDALREALADEQIGRAVARLALLIYRHIGLLAAVRRPIGMLTAKGREDRRVIVKMRNQIAIDAALAAPGDVVALWGGEHIAGIAAGLRRHGYRRTGRKWLSALSKYHKLPAATEAN